MLAGAADGFAPARRYYGGAGGLATSGSQQPHLTAG